MMFRKALSVLSCWGILLIASTVPVAYAFIDMSFPLISIGGSIGRMALPRVGVSSSEKEFEPAAMYGGSTGRISSQVVEEGFHCEHFGSCPGCVMTDRVLGVDVVESVQRFFASPSIQRQSTSSTSTSTSFSPNQLQFTMRLPSNITQWRTQAKLAVASQYWGSRDGCTFGLYERNSHRVVPIPHCAVHHPQINTAIALLTQATANAQTVAYNETFLTGQLRYVQCQVERATNKVCLTLVWNADHLKGCQPYLSRLVKELKKATSISNYSDIWHSIWVNLNTGTGNNIFSRGDNKWFRLEGPEYVREPIHSSTLQEHCGFFFFTPSTFRQANMDGFEVIAQYVAKLVPPKSTVCELYAGVGILGLTALAYHHMAENDNPADTALRWLRCSDENPANLKCFERSIRSMPASITGASTVSSKQSTRKKANKSTSKATYMVASATTAVQEGQALGASVLLVDPPRSGLDEFVLTELCKPRNPKQPHVEDLLLLDDEGSSNINLLNDVTTLIYVSCGFESFSRDCERILSANAGWSIHSSIGYLLFPGSNHIETVTLFRRQLSFKRTPVKKVTSFGSFARQKR